MPNVKHDSASLQRTKNNISTNAENGNDLCFHCQQALPKYNNIVARVDGLEHLVCCHGCRAVAEYIADSGLGKFYYYRQQASDKEAQQESLQSQSLARQQWTFLDKTVSNKKYVIQNQSGFYTIDIAVSGIYCSSCSWLISKALQRYNPDMRVDIDLSSKNIHLIYPVDVNASELMMLIANLGYKPSPIALGDNERTSEIAHSLEKKVFLKRLAVAGFGMMQVMMYAIGTYLGEYYSIDASLNRFLLLLSMLVSTVVVFYSGRVFFSNALSDLKNRHLGMDVPVALAIGGAYFPSVYTVLTNKSGHVYFDSAVMFVFFLLLGRFIEMRARHRLSSTPLALQRLLPSMVEIKRDDKKIMITPSEVQAQDQLELMKSDCLAFDARILNGSGQFDESLITGEAQPVPKQTGDAVLAGSQLISGELTVAASGSWADSSIAKIERLLKSANAAHDTVQPLLRASRYFVAGVLVLSLLVSVFWWFYQPSRVFEITLAMLIASCPCALSLAAPVAVTAASKALRQAGVLLANTDVLQLIPKLSLWCFDKTGTLTQAKASIAHAELLMNEVPSANEKGLANEEDLLNDFLSLMANMETHSEHPLASAFSSISPSQHRFESIESLTGLGIVAHVSGETYYLGKREWVLEQSEYRVDRFTFTEQDSQYEDCSEVVLANTQQLLARALISHQLRESAKVFVSSLHTTTRQSNRTYSGLTCPQKAMILSGDRQSSVDSLAQKLGIKIAFGGLLAEQKKNLILEQQDQGNCVAMVGDGVNDAPVLASADVSVAMASGSELSQTQADIILLNGRLDSLSQLEKIAFAARNITRQNLVWAFIYNALALPLAATGYLSPWIAALGMSLSSLFVVLNALRINTL